MELFHQQNLIGTPLAESQRPKSVEKIVGQKNICKIIARFRKTKSLPNMILWGPPGTGKTSFALALIHEFSLKNFKVNAVDIGSKDLKELGEKAKDNRLMYNEQTVIFIDEIHRLNKSQQDVLLPYIERGDFVLIGATTENPSYELNKAVLSRSELVIFEKLSKPSLQKLLSQVVNLDFLSHEAMEFLLEYADGDGRRLMLSIEGIMLNRGYGEEKKVGLEELKSSLGAKHIIYDKDGDQHYDIVSAFIKSIRGSDADAGLYYLARMLEAGEDPVFIARRLVILASEDVGNADPRALTIAVSGAQAVELIGMPEAAINLAQVVTYLSSAPKSNRSYIGLNLAKDCVQKTGALEVPLHLKSSRTEAMKKLGYGVDYKYPHDYPKHYVHQGYLPAQIMNIKFYDPSDRGFEKQIKEYLQWLKKNSHDN